MISRAEPGNIRLVNIPEILEVKLEAKVYIRLDITVLSIFNPVLVIERDTDQFNGGKLDSAYNGTAVVRQVPRIFSFGQDI